MSGQTNRQKNLELLSLARNLVATDTDACRQALCTSIKKIHDQRPEAANEEQKLSLRPKLASRTSSVVASQPIELKTAKRAASRASRISQASADGVKSRQKSETIVVVGTEGIRNTGNAGNEKVEKVIEEKPIENKAIEKEQGVKEQSVGKSEKSEKSTEKAEEQHNGKLFLNPIQSFKNNHSPITSSTPEMTRSRMVQKLHNERESNTAYQKSRLSDLCVPIPSPLPAESPLVAPIRVLSPLRKLDANASPAQGTAGKQHSVNTTELARMHSRMPSQTSKLSTMSTNTVIQRLLKPTIASAARGKNKHEGSPLPRQPKLQRLYGPSPQAPSGQLSAKGMGPPRGQDKMLPIKPRKVPTPQPSIFSSCYPVKNIKSPSKTNTEQLNNTMVKSVELANTSKPQVQGVKLPSQGVLVMPKNVNIPVANPQHPLTPVRMGPPRISEKSISVLVQTPSLPEINDGDGSSLLLDWAATPNVRALVHEQKNSDIRKLIGHVPEIHLEQVFGDVKRAHAQKRANARANQ